jgi:hypothetical protein
MATPSCLWKANSGISTYKEFTQKSVVTSITILNPDTATKTVTIHRTPSSEIGSPVNYYRTSCKLKHAVSITTNATLELNNLKWVFEEGDVLSFSFTGDTGVLANIYVDGVLLD